MTEIIRDLGNRYGNLGSALIRHDGRLLVISGTDAYGYSEWLAVPSNAHGAVTNWRDYATRGSREELMEALAEICHCGSPMRGSDHCPHCGCEQYETSLVRDCGQTYDAEYDEPGYEETFRDIVQDEVDAMKRYLAGDDPRRGSDTPLGEAYGG